MFSGCPDQMQGTDIWVDKKLDGQAAITTWHQQMQVQVRLEFNESNQCQHLTHKLSVLHVRSTQNLLVNPAQDSSYL